jgi:hypothetical protein
MRGANVLRDSCAATGDLSHAQHFASHVPRACGFAPRKNFSRAMNSRLTAPYYNSQLSADEKPPRPAMAGAAPRASGARAHRSRVRWLFSLVVFLSLTRRA